MRHSSYQLQSGEQLILESKKSFQFYAERLTIAFMWLVIEGIFLIVVIHTFDTAKTSVLQSSSPFSVPFLYGGYLVLALVFWSLFLWQSVVCLVDLFQAELALTNRRLLGRLFNKSRTAFKIIEIPIEDITAISERSSGFDYQTSGNKESYHSQFLSLNSRLVRQVREINSLVSEQR